MKPIKSNTSLSVTLCLILTVTYPGFVQAVTDAELEALEKQIEQQEIDEKKQAEATEKKKAETEVKRKAKEKRKAEVEAKRKQEEEQKHKVEAEAKRKAEESRLSEIERQRQEDENRKKAKEEKRDKFSQYMENGDSAMDNKEYEEALRVYTQALVFFPDDFSAISSQSRAREFRDNCVALIGEWEWAFGMPVTVNADGSLQLKALIPNHGTWECTDPSQRKFTLRWVVGGWVDNATLTADGNKVDAINNIGWRFQGWRKGTKEVTPTQDIKL
jgi:hypothetical protein